jgi:site-specific recombinase XerD
MMVRTESLLRSRNMAMPLSDLLELFVATKRTEGRAEKTLSWYEEMIGRFVAFLTDGAEPGLEDLSLDNARAFVASLQRQKTRYQTHPFRHETRGGLSPSTIHAYVRAIKAFASWLCEEGFTADNRLERLKRPKLPEPMIEVLSNDEISRILTSLNPNTRLGSRQHLIITVLLETGIRATELCTLTLDRVDLKADALRVMGKGKKERLVYFAATTKKYLIRYLTTFRPESDHDQLILNLDGSPMTYNNLAHTIKGIGKSVGVPRLHAHLLRHTFAVNYLVNGGDVMTLQRMLGHTSLDVTKTYMHLAEAHVQVQHHRFSPIEHLVREGYKV